MIEEVVRYSNKLKNEYSSIEELLDENDIILIEDEYINELEAYTIKIRNKDFIVINKKIRGLERNFIICHEIYHILKHDIDSRCFSRIRGNDRCEIEANIFSIFFLGIQNYISTNTKISKIINQTINTISSSCFF